MTSKTQSLLEFEFGRDGCKTHVLHHPIKGCHIIFLLKNSIHPITFNNISINFQFG